MKKTFVILTSILLMCIMLIGCTESNITLSTSRDLNKNLSILSNTVKRLDTIDNSYLVNDDLYALEEISTDSQKINGEKLSNITALASNNIENSSEISAENIALRDDLKEALKDEIISRLYCDQNGNCKLCGEKFTCNNNGTCNSCNQTIICDENGNCSSCGNTLYLSENKSCNSCNNSCVSSGNSVNIPSNISSKLIKISADNKELIADKLNYTNLDENNPILTSENLETNHEDVDSNYKNSTKDNGIIDNTIPVVDNKQEGKENNTDLNKTDNIENKNEISTSTNNENYTNIDSDLDSKNNTILYDDLPRIRIIYYTEESTSPSEIGYTPRHIEKLNSRAISNTLENYLNKVQKLYTMTADVVEANNNLLAKRNLILDTIDETRTLNSYIEKGTYTPNENQIDALRNYIIDIKATIKNIRNCNGELTNEINKISNENNGLSQSIDVISSNYLKILNQLDTRISYHENAIATLEQIKNILEENYNNFIDNETPDNNGIIDNNQSSNDTIDNEFNDNTNNEATVDTPPSDISDSNIADDKINTPTDTDPENNSNVIIDTTKNNNSNEEENMGPINNPSANENTTVDTSTTTEDNGGSSEENKVLTDKEIVENSPINENPEKESSNEKNTITDSNINNENKTQNNTDDSTKLDNSLNSSNNSVNNNGESFDDNNEITGNVESVDNGLIKSNIDTYHNSTFGYSNIDTLNHNTSNKAITNENTDNVNNTDLVDNNTILNDNMSTNENIIDDNNFLNNGISNDNNMIYNNGNLNNGNIYSNSIINDNNIGENDLGNISYRYDDNGHLYNNTNGFDSAGINNQNVNNNNVNTYKYNTMVDTINRGTVNNGINKL